jgi:hypothetical protein
MDNQTRDQIRDLVAASKLDKALVAFSDWAKLHGDKELQNMIIGRQGELRNLKKEIDMGIAEDANVRRNKIAGAILSMLDDAEDATPSSASNATSSSTVVASNTNTPSVSATPKQKTLLFMGANPPNTRSLQLEVEHSRIAAKLNNYYRIEVEKFTSASDIPELIVSKEPNIIHFSGHGKDPNSSEAGEKDRAIGYKLPTGYDQKGGIVVFDDDMLSMKILDDDVLDYLFQSAVDGLGIKIDVVVFNSCHSESQAKVVCKHVDYVVGTARAINDDVAIAFASGFYYALGQGKSVEKAFTTGKMQAVIKDFKSKDLIVLYKGGERQNM